MVLEFLIVSTKMIAIFICMLLFLLSLLFSIMSSATYYYHLRDSKLFLDSTHNSLKLARKFKPVFKKLYIRPGLSFVVEARFSDSLSFKRSIVDGDFKGVRF